MPFFYIFKPFLGNYSDIYTYNQLKNHIFAVKIMIHKVESFISRYKLLTHRAKVLVALSGGADSVALLVALLKLGYRCEAVHCNFHLRGTESDRDEAFVRQLCEKKGVKLTITHFDTAAHAKAHGISIEMAARELRYKLFEELRSSTGAEAIAVAHHRDDSAETVLLNLIRGTGIKGLRGIQPRNGNIVRPLLCVGRADIIDYLKWREEDFVTDSTNLTTDYTRNKIRLEVIPKLAEFNPSIQESLAATAQRIAEAELIYSQAIAEATKRVKKGDCISIKALKKEVAPATLLHEILAPLGFNGTQTDNIFEALGSDGCREITNSSWRVIKERGSLCILPNGRKEPYCSTLPDRGSVCTPTGILLLSTHAFDGNIPRDRYSAYLDLDSVQLPLTLRTARQGDRFAPFGMRGTKLVSDYLTDKKRSTADKEKQLVVTDASGAIAWLVGERPAAPFCVKESTKEVIHLTWTK